MRKRDTKKTRMSWQLAFSTMWTTKIKVEVQRKRAAFPQDSQIPMIYKNTYKRTKIIKSTVRRIQVFLNP